MTPPKPVLAVTEVDRDIGNKVELSGGFQFSMAGIYI